MACCDFCYREYLAVNVSKYHKSQPKSNHYGVFIFFFERPAFFTRLFFLSLKVSGCSYACLFCFSFSFFIISYLGNICVKFNIVPNFCKKFVVFVPVPLCTHCSLYNLGGGEEETKVCLAFSLSSRKISLSTSLSFLPLRLLLHDPYYLFAWRGRGGERKVNRPKGTQRERERR